MNFAYVRLTGFVTDFAAVEPDGSYLSFRIRDREGEVRAQAYRQTAMALLGAGVVPSPGDEVSIEGTLRVRDEDAAIVLNSPDGLILTRRVPDISALSALEGMDLGERAGVVAQVRRIRDIGNLRILSLRSGNAEADAVVALAAPGSAGAPAPSPGAWVHVTGGIGDYRGRRQLLAMPADVSLAPAPAPESRPLAAMTRDLEGQWLTTRAALVRVAPFRGGVRLVLGGADGAEITATVFDAAWVGVPFSATVRPGEALWVSGRLTDYRGALGLQPEISVDIAR